MEKLVVTRATFDSVLRTLSEHKVLAIDTETTGLHPYQSDVLFSIIIAGAPGTYYFNFEDYPEITQDQCLNDEKYWQALRDFLKEPRIYIFQNAKFDLAFLSKENISLGGYIHDTKTRARLLWNDHMSYSLKDIAKRDIGEEKSDAVEKYIAEHCLFEMVENPHKKQKERKVKYHEVPFDIISSYGLQDGLVTYNLWQHQKGCFAQEDQSRRNRHSSISKVHSLEMRLIPVIFEMEKIGVRIDRTYCENAIEYENLQCLKATQKFKELTGKDFVDSAKNFKEVFDVEKVPKTAKGNPSFDKKSLGTLKGDPIADLILKYRDSKHQAQFFQGFLHYADKEDNVHASFQSDGTASGRFSCSNPNMQQLTRPEEGTEGYEVRGAIVPRDGFFLAEFDYKSQEYIHMLELAEAHELIEQVKAGLDIHQATADIVGRGMTRQQAKTLNFALAYGAGPTKLGEMLKITMEEAKKLRSDYFNAIPSVGKFLKRVVSEAEDYKKIVNWCGRISRFPDSREAYKAPNYLIQGGCADITKTALLNVAVFLQGKKSRIILTVHDSIVLEVHETESEIIPQVRKIMEQAYPARHIPLKVSVDVSRTNLAETDTWVESPLPTV